MFLLLLCNDREVLGPWVNGRKTNMLTSAVVAALVALSVILTASVLFPAITPGQILAIMACCDPVVFPSRGNGGADAPECYPCPRHRSCRASQPAQRQQEADALAAGLAPQGTLRTVSPAASARPA